MRICPGALSAIRDHARRGRPNEVAGLLGADASGLVTTAVALGEGTPEGVELPHAAVSAAAAELRGRGLGAAGSYHSHVEHGAYPTEADRLAMVAGEAMVIVCARTLDVRAFVLAGDRVHVRPEELTVEPDAPL